jgi:broad specificity phosphatase PhoE
LKEEQKWPDLIWILRHGESMGNVSRETAEAAGLSVIEMTTREIDVPLSPLGERQSKALGRWFVTLPPEQRPTVVLSSPYVRARITAQMVLTTANIDPKNITFLVDERLREKEFGILNRLTSFGIKEKYPEHAEARSLLGKFYFRPPGGESWCDVILRLRSLIDTLTREYSQERVLIVSHQVVVNCFRYLFERLTEEQILAIDRDGDVPNCSITSYEYEPSAGNAGQLSLRLSNFTMPLEEAGEQITAEHNVSTKS